MLVDPGQREADTDEEEAGEDPKTTRPQMVPWWMRVLSALHKAPSDQRDGPVGGAGRRSRDQSCVVKETRRPSWAAKLVRRQTPDLSGEQRVRKPRRTPRV